jgi:hypothetical protein
MHFDILDVIQILLIEPGSRRGPGSFPLREPLYMYQMTPYSPEINSIAPGTHSNR